jgi:uncharacterized protein involved in outer membrane biogenesis
MKKLRYFLLILMLLTGGSLGAGWAFATGLFRAGVEKAAAYALQVDVTIGSIKLRPLSNQLEIVDMVIGNPEGFQTRSAFQIRRATIHADLRSFLSEEPTIDLIELDRPKVTLERGLRTSNLKELIANASRLQTATGEPEPIEESAPDTVKKRLKINKVIVDGTEVALSAPILRGQELVVPLTRIELNDVGEEKERVRIPELLKILIDRILVQTLREGAGVIPSGFATIEEPVGQALDGVRDGLRGILGRDQQP